MASEVPVLSIVGRSNSGKTTLIEKLLPRLVSRGWTVGTLKHDVHGFTMDHPGKDTYRHFEAGADRVVIAGPREMAMRFRLSAEPDRQALVSDHFQGMDLVLTEGYRTGSWPKVEVVRSERSPTPLCLNDDTLQALVTDLPGPFPVPFFGLEETEDLAGWIEGTLLGGPK